MAEENQLSFIKDFVKFVPRTEIAWEQINEPLIESLNCAPKKTNVLLIWSDVITGEIIDELNAFSSSNLILIINEKTPSLRRAEMLLQSNIMCIFSYNHIPVTTESIYQICLNSSHLTDHSKEKGIKRILKLAEKEDTGSPPVFTCLFSNGVLIEHSNNATVASLQLKGKRASALYLGSLSPDYLRELDKIIPQELGGQVLINQHHMDDSERERITSFSSKFQLIDSPSQDELIQTCSLMALPSLKKSVWEGPEAQLNAKINFILKSKELQQLVFCLEGFDSAKSEKMLSLEMAKAIVESTDASTRPKMLKYKKEIIQKTFIILNSNSRGIQEELLRLLFCVSTQQHIVIAVGPQKHYTYLLETAEGYENNPFYAHRSVHVVVSSKKKLPVMVKELLRSTQFILEEDQEFITFEILESFKPLQSAYDAMIGKVQTEFPKLSNAVDLDSGQSASMIFENLLSRHEGARQETAIFDNPDEKKAFHTYLTRVTPVASKTAFPNNMKDLILIIQSIIFLILEKPKHKLKTNLGPSKFIADNKLVLTPLNSYVQDLEKLMTQFKNDSTKVPVKQASARKDKLIEDVKHIEFVIQQIQLQYAFLQLATPQPSLFHDFKPEKLYNPELLADQSPFMEINRLLEDIMSKQFT